MTFVNRLEGIGVSPADCVRVAAALEDEVQTQQPILDWKTALRAQGVTCEGDSLEREVIRCASENALPRIDSLPVHAAVKKLLRKELERYLGPRAASDPEMEAGSYAFSVAFKTATLRRFPAGPMDWTISGIPRSSLLKIPFLDMPRSLYFIAAKLGGVKPAFYVYIAPAPRKRALVIDTEVRRAYYRMAKSLELQPEMLGIVARSWLHDTTLFSEMPHLAAINEPYVKHGGCLTTVGEAPADSGFLERSPERRKRYESGELRPKLGLAMWPRKAAIGWAREHPELE